MYSAPFESEETSPHFDACQTIWNLPGTLETVR